MIEFLKWWETIKYAWTKNLAYRINFFLEIIGPILIFFFVQYNLWSSIYGDSTNLIIQGYTKSQMLSYFGWTLIVGMLARGHMSGNLAEDIRLGRISAYLIYPFDFWKFHGASFIGFQGIQLFIAFISIIFLTCFNIITISSSSSLMLGILYCLFVSCFWFTVQFLLGILSFWLAETWILRVIFNLISAFLAGSYFPIEIYPTWIQKVLHYLPFSYIQYYPVKILMGDTHLIGQSMIMVILWWIPLLIITNLIWKKGIRLYTAAGM